jgi:hypothetical protein
VDLRLCSTEVRTKAVPVLLRILESEAKVTKDVLLLINVADPDPNKSQNSGALEFQNGTMEGPWTLAIEAWRLKIGAVEGL